MTDVLSASPSPRPPRYDSLDAVRGVALLAMFVFHIVWDLGYFALVPADWPTAPWFRAYGHAIASAFIGLAGIGMVLAAQRSANLRPALIRIGRVTLAAIVVSAATYALFPDSFIFFGILHLIALASLCALPLLRAPNFALAGLACVALLLPAVVALPIFDHPAFWWLGLGTDAPRSNDWRPFLPWFGVLLLGVLAGRLIVQRGLPYGWSRWQARGAASRALVWGGRHSLMIYLVHQPIFIAIVFVIAKMAGPRPLPVTPFAQGCEQQCVRSNGEAPYCRRVCGCVVEQSQVQGLWRAVLADKLSPEERQRFDALTRNCVKFEADGGLH